MNYDKQTPLTDEEIRYINSKEKVKVTPLSSYPENDVHMEIIWNLPIKITRNEDEIWFNGFKESNKENWWLVYPEIYTENNFFNLFEVKQFENIDHAIEHALKQYQKWLTKRMSDIQEYLKQ